MKRMYSIDERIYNPFGDELISSTEFLIKKYGGREDVYISFTELDKLGINPQSRYQTPLGIYTYPLHRILSRVGPENADKARPIGSYVPYAGKNPWVWIIEPDMSRGRFISDISDKGVYNDNDMW